MQLEYRTKVWAKTKNDKLETISHEFQKSSEKFKLQLK